MRGWGFSSVTIGSTGQASDTAGVDDIALDNLSILGLNGAPTAFLKFTFECVQCILYDFDCVLHCVRRSLRSFFHYGPEISPLCTLTVPISYNGTGQPQPVYLQRQLQINAITNVSGPPGTTVTSSVCIGYFAGSCGTIQTTVKASVVTAKGKVIKGATVVGSSGHIYN